MGLTIIIIIITQTFILSTTALSVFVPTAPPRFDVFGEQLVQSWTTTTTTTTTTTRRTTNNKNDEQQPVIVVVEEVMRSCGGAVQGIREPLVKSSPEDKEFVYLNRANDGFLFWNDGGYSFGPVQWNDDDNLFLSNFMFGTSRIVLSCHGDLETNNDGSIRNIETNVLQKTKFPGLDPPTPAWNHPPMIVVEENSPPLSLSIDFHTSIRCSMPSTSQPWMLRRAKWERKEENREDQTTESNDNDDKDDATTALGSYLHSNTVWCWAAVVPTSNLAAECTKNIIVGDGKAMYMGAICDDTNVVKAIVRLYNEENALVSVQCLEGKLHS